MLSTKQACYATTATFSSYLRLLLIISSLYLIFLASRVDLLLADNPTTNNGGHQNRLVVNCSNIEEVLDKCGANASYSHTIPSSQFPTSLEQLKGSCSKIQEGLSCLRKYSKCLHSLTRRALAGFIDGRRKHMRSICSNIRSQVSKEFVDTFNCLSKTKKKKLKETESNSITHIDAILSGQVKDFKERFQRSCCAIHDYRQRSLSQLDPECPDPAYRSVLENYIDSVVGQAVEFACPDPKTGICNTFKPLILDTNKPLTKSLTRAGTELLIVLTDPEKNKDRR